MHTWQNDTKKLSPNAAPVLSGISLLRRDQPDTRAATLGEGGQTGVCYDCRDISQENLFSSELCEVFCNPHASTLEILS